MEIILHPKAQYQAYHGTEREAWLKIARARETQLTMAYALSEMAALGFSQEQIRGANTFVQIVLNMGENPPPPMQERYPPQPLKEPPIKHAETTET